MSFSKIIKRLFINYEISNDIFIYVKCFYLDLFMCHLETDWECGTNRILKKFKIFFFVKI